MLRWQWQSSWCTLSTAYCCSAPAWSSDRCSRWSLSARTPAERKRCRWRWRTLSSHIAPNWNKSINEKTSVLHHKPLTCLTIVTSRTSSELNIVWKQGRNQNATYNISRNYIGVFRKWFLFRISWKLLRPFAKRLQIIVFFISFYT